jgi:hypothetical protein
LRLFNEPVSPDAVVYPKMGSMVRKVKRAVTNFYMQLTLHQNLLESLNQRG